MSQAIVADAAPAGVHALGDLPGDTDAPATADASTSTAPASREREIAIDVDTAREASERRAENPTEAQARDLRPAPLARGERKLVVLPWAEVWPDTTAARKTLTITVTPSRLTVVDVKL